MNMAGLNGKKWTRSSACAENSCVEVAIGDDVIGIRNSDNPDTVVLFTPAEWKVLTLGVRAGDFDAPAV